MVPLEMDVKTTPDTGIFKNGRSEVPVPNQGEQVSSHLREEEKDFSNNGLLHLQKYISIVLTDKFQTQWHRISQSNFARLVRKLQR